MDLDKEESNLTYDHWWESHDPSVLTKKMVARSYARAWNPLQEMGPIINPGKVCLSKIWSLQSFLQKRKVQTRFDFKEKGNYRPLANRREANKPKDWASLQKQWPAIDWNNNLLDLNFQALPEEDALEANKLLEEIKSLWDVFTANMLAIKDKKYHETQLLI